MREVAFYQNHLDRVSRSFAFCIQELEQPFRQWVSLSYLLCRVLDTVEDSNWPDPRLRDGQYAEFDSFILALPAPNAVADWRARFPSSIPESEKTLLDEAHLLFADLHESPAGVRSSIRETVSKMCAGMKYYSTRTRSGALRLADLADVNRYCYFVAGVVGELLSKVLLEHRTDFRPKTDFFKNAFHFGLFLQKVNLLKDQRGDEREGRFLVPARPQLLASLRENAQGALAYLTSLPEDEKGYRVFCAWSLFLGAASLAWVEKSYAADDGSKIPRQITQELLAAVKAIALDNDALRAGFAQYFPELPEFTAPPAPTHDDGAWFSNLCGSTLDRSELAELRMV